MGAVATCAPHEKLRKGSGNLFLIYYGTLRSFIAVAQSEVRKKERAPASRSSRWGLLSQTKCGAGSVLRPRETVPSSDDNVSGTNYRHRNRAAPGRPLFRKHSATMYNSKVGLVLLSEGPQARR